MFKKFSYVFALVLISFGLLTLSSCEKDKDDDVVDMAKVLVTHASPNAPGVDLLIDDTKVNSAALSFPQSTAYLDVKAGTRNVKVNVAGTTTTVISANIDFMKDKNYSLFAIDSVSKISSLLLTDDLTAPASGKSHVRFVHLSPNAPAVDIAVTGGPVLFSNVSFKGYQGFSPVDAGTYNLEVRLAGTTTVVLPLPGIALANGKIYTVFARGFVGGAGAQALNAQIIANN